VKKMTKFALVVFALTLVAGARAGESGTVDHQFDSKKWLVCSTRGFMATTMVHQAHDEGKSIDDVIREEYPNSKDLLVDLTRLGDNMVHVGGARVNSQADAGRLAEFLSGVCYSSIQAATSE
jgi:hypothetical protein